jgi:hypothetical protein
MVDTPRTLAQVQALLADNASGNISPQDIRDMVMSIADPTPGGGFGLGYPGTAMGARAVSTNVATDTYVYPTWNQAVVDPLGMIQSSSISTMFGTLTAGTWLRVPSGVWAVGNFAGWDADTTGTRWVGYRVVDDRYAEDPFLSQYYGLPLTQNGYPAAQAQADSAACGGILGVAAEVVAATTGNSTAGQGLAIAPYVWQDSGTQRTSPYGAVMLTKLGNV